MSPITLEAWLGAHPYLEPVGRFCREVEAAAGSVTPSRSVPEWEVYDADFRAGVPLLKSVDAEMDLAECGRAVVALVERLASDPKAGKLAVGASALRAELQGGDTSPGRVMDWLLGEGTFTPTAPGLLRYLGWTAIARHLAPVVEQYAGWRDEERWLRPYCPTCGSPPSMAQLVGTDPGRMRFLSCGCCGTHWRYSRTSCPFCERDDQRLVVLAVEGEGGLRIDHCESCRGYLKTYDGQGDEAVLLADWTSLHLDVAAIDRGLERQAASLFELGSISRKEPAAR